VLGDSGKFTLSRSSARDKGSWQGQGLGHCRRDDSAGERRKAAGSSANRVSTQSDRSAEVRSLCLSRTSRPLPLWMPRPLSRAIRNARDAEICDRGSMAGKTRGNGAGTRYPRPLIIRRFLLTREIIREAPPLICVCYTTMERHVAGGRRVRAREREREKGPGRAHLHRYNQSGVILFLTWARVECVPRCGLGWLGEGLVEGQGMCVRARVRARPFNNNNPAL
jgi:hypothetical protein